MCLYPKIGINKKYIPNKKNGGIVPKLKDKRVLYAPFSCGKCMECMKRKARNYSIRLQEEIRTDKSGKFVTLTFSDDSFKELGKKIKGLSGYDMDNEIATLAVRRFLERWRKAKKKSVKHWLVTELGQTKTERIHLHGILFTNERAFISEKWKYGIVSIGKEKWLNGKLIHEGVSYVNEATISYIVKYVSKADGKHKEYSPKVLCTAGIGRGYLNRMDSQRNRYNDKQETKETYTTRQGVKIALPEYYRNHIYTEEEREKLWIAKLDKEELWIDGMKIDISKGYEEYYRVLERIRDKAKRLGYGDNAKNWERRRYENERRNLGKKKKNNNSEEEE